MVALQLLAPAEYVIESEHSHKILIAVYFFHK